MSTKIWPLGFVFLLYSCGGSEPAPAVSPSSAIEDRSIDKWEISRDSLGPMSGNVVVLALDSENLVQEWLDQKRPRLKISCVEDNTIVSLWIGTDAQPELRKLGPERHSVTLQLGDLEPQRGIALEYGVDELLLGGKELAEQLAKVRTIDISFIPFNAKPAVARFEVSGLRRHIEEVSRPCRWTMMQQTE